MPNENHPIGGKVYDNNNNTISGATVYLIDTTTGERTPTAQNKTTNSAGEYIVNAYDLPSGASDGDNYEVVVTKTGYEETRITGTMTFGSPEEDADIYMEVDNHTMPFTTRDHLRLQNLKSTLSKFKQNFIVWANNKAPASATAEVITSGGGGRGKGYTTSGNPVVNLNSNQVAYITQLTVQVRTASKVCAFEIVKCSAADGGGTATPVSGIVYLANGTLVETKPFTIKFAEPIRIDYGDDSALSVGIRITATGSSTYVDAMMEGHILEE